LIEVQIGDRPANNAQVYRVATNSFLAQGGDLYETFPHAKQLDTSKLLLELVIEYFKQHGEIEPPKLGRLVPAVRRR
jgi:2',3'-cyclic-nucleotide 2'-phosphodiesterase (5'-nucleotidase family)